MDLSGDLDALGEAVRTSPGSVVPTGARTQWQVGGDAPSGTAVEAPAGVVSYDPADLTITVGAGTAVSELDAVLDEAGQQCPLDPRDDRATVGGVLACGLSGHRRLRWGPVRDRALEVRMVLADGRTVKGGGPTVKNVTGFDLPRLVVGSLGTLGVLGQVTLRCQPRPEVGRWSSGTVDPFELRRTLFRPSCVAWDGTVTWCLLEGHPGDVGAQEQACELEPSGPPPWPEGPVRGRVSVSPGNVARLGNALAGIPNLSWLAEVGVGTVHVASPEPDRVEEARRLAHDLGGWLLREAGDGLDGYGVPLPAEAVARRIKAALDPDNRLNPGRIPL